MPQAGLEPANARNRSSRMFTDDSTGTRIKYDGFPLLKMQYFALKCKGLPKVLQQMLKCSNTQATKKGAVYAAPGPSMLAPHIGGNTRSMA